MAINFLDLLRQREEEGRRFPGTYAPVNPGQVSPTAPPEVPGIPIDVFANQQAPAPTAAITPNDLVPRDVGNADFAIEAAKANRTTQERLKNEGLQHKGMFGLKGTLRDVLGLVGDSLLVGSGRDSVYDKVRQREREGDAMAGFTADPDAAAERMSGINPGAASKMQDLAIQQQLKRAQLQSLEQYRQSQIETRDFERTSKAANVVARIFASPVARTRPDLAMRQAREVAARAGVPLETIGVREDMSPEEMEMYSNRDMSVNQTMQLPYTERRTAAAETNAAANMTRASRPPAGRPLPPRSVAQVDAEVADAVLSGRATPAQQQYYNDRLKRGGKGRGTPRPTGVGGPPPGFKLGRKINP